MNVIKTVMKVIKGLVMKGNSIQLQTKSFYNLFLPYCTKSALTFFCEIALTYKSKTGFSANEG